MVHRSASSGYEKQADAYRRARPSYHPDVADLTAALATDPTGRSEAELIELGAGTGIFTAQLIERDVNVTAIEPVHAMRDALTESLPAVTALEGTAEHIPLEDDSASAVVASQSFHWFDHGPAMEEIARVLRPGGHLITVWNVRDNGVDWVAACTEVIEHHAIGTPRHNTMAWRRAIDADRRFRLVEDRSVANPYPTTGAGVVDRVLSTSFIAALDDEERRSVVADIERIVEPLGESFNYPYVSELQAWRYDGPGDEATC